MTRLIALPSPMVCPVCHCRVHSRQSDTTAKFQVGSLTICADCATICVVTLSEPDAKGNTRFTMAVAPQDRVDNVAAVTAEMTARILRRTFVQVL